MPVLTPAERDAFLSEPGILMRVATVTPQGRPHVTPIWFIREADRIYFTPRQRSSWLEHIRANPWVALSIDESDAPYRKVLVEGRATILHEPGEDDAWRDLYRRIARRYLPDADADAYVEATLDQPRALLAVELSAAHVRTWRMPVGDEPYWGIWASRYYTPDARLRATSGDAPAAPRTRERDDP